MITEHSLIKLETNNTKISRKNIWILNNILLNKHWVKKKSWKKLEYVLTWTVRKREGKKKTFPDKQKPREINASRSAKQNNQGVSLGRRNLTLDGNMDSYR